ncbi:MAG: cytochrome-c peroxidase, partial [Bilophila sp.]
DLLQTWVHQTRLTCYATGLASPEFATEPVQPLPDAVPVDNRKVDLGARLFFDTRLSGNNAMTCASCHFLNHSGADGKEAPSGITGEVVELNAPTVFNAVFHLRQFWNGRARDLQEQALDPPVDPREMGSGNWTEICNRLAQSASLQQEFMELYADGITAQNVGNALAEFEKTLITPNCRFDRYLKGDKNAISVIEKDGYALFKASRCATCHVGKALGGQSVEYLNLKADFYADRQVVPRPAD